MDPVFSKIQQGVWTVWMILALLLYFRLNEFILLNHLHDVPDLASKEWSGSFKDIMLASPLIFLYGRKGFWIRKLNIQISTHLITHQ